MISMNSKMHIASRNNVSFGRVIKRDDELIQCIGNKGLRAIGIVEKEFQSQIWALEKANIDIWIKKCMKSGVLGACLEDRTKSTPSFHAVIEGSGLDVVASYMTKKDLEFKSVTSIAGTRRYFSQLIANGIKVISERAKNKAV